MLSSWEEFQFIKIMRPVARNLPKKSLTWNLILLWTVVWVCRLIVYGLEHEWCGGESKLFLSLSGINVISKLSVTWAEFVTGSLLNMFQ